ncbi:hypothetical protein O9H85_24190 [Paenibacillus filicis]|uniref:Uncharacterized protein n=1 Tax=Paenibacillus gyeongsangnamensis TaxID=3388067 RepID=A0ABT4QF20_9BACL|nr:hypothetical protein [Paenibacillus filicis]MCZ8515450.1 hypothetical protein [Paenibacillus filicis]
MALDLPGIRIFENAQAVQASLQNCLDKKRASLLKNVFRIFSKINEFRADYEEVKRWATPLHHIADLLHPDVDKSSESDRFHMNHFLAWLDSTYTNPQDEPMVKNLKSYTIGFWDGLFTCYDYPYLPRTSNDHEL